MSGRTTVPLTTKARKDGSDGLSKECVYSLAQQHSLQPEHALRNQRRMKALEMAALRTASYSI